MKFGNKTIFIIVISVFLIISCDDCCEMTDYESYLPLKIGNTWKYRTGGNWEVIGTENLKGSLFSKISVSAGDEYGGEISHYLYYRFEKSKLYKFYQSDSVEVVIADFSLKEGEMFHQENTGYNVTVLSDDPDGFEIYYDHPDWIDEEMATLFKADVGIIGHCATAWEKCNYNDLVECDLK